MCVKFAENDSKASRIKDHTDHRKRDYSMPFIGGGVLVYRDFKGFGGNDFIYHINGNELTLDK